MRQFEALQLSLNLQHTSCDEINKNLFGPKTF